MNEDYLWDRTGKPDADVRELENVLGTLRYQPRPLVVPVGPLTSSRHKFAFGLAIAATILLALVAAGLWLALRRQEATRHPEVVRTTPSQSDIEQRGVLQVTNGMNQKATSASQDNNKSRDLATSQPPSSHKSRRLQTATRRNAPLRLDGLTAGQRAEGEAAKEQLLLALRVVSVKLNLAQRKTQTPLPTNSIHN